MGYPLSGIAIFGMEPPTDDATCQLLGLNPQPIAIGYIGKQQEHDFKEEKCSNHLQITNISAVNTKTQMPRQAWCLRLTPPNGGFFFREIRLRAKIHGKSRGKRNDVGCRSHIKPFLVGGWATPLKNMTSSLG